jgi:predicted nucleic-acid-binding Zn-ribbon protein
MVTPAPQRPCPWCEGTDFVVVEGVFLEISDYSRRFDTVTCTSCGHTSFFTKTASGNLPGRPVQAPGHPPYR